MFYHYLVHRVNMHTDETPNVKYSSPITYIWDIENLCTKKCRYSCLMILFLSSYYCFYLGSATSVLEFLSQKDKERIQEMKQATDLKAAQLQARTLAQNASSSRPQASSPDMAHCSWHTAWSGGTATTRAGTFKPFAKDPEKQKRYEEFVVNMKRGQKGGC